MRQLPVLIVLSLFSISMTAQEELQQGKVYQGQNTLTVSSVGVTFTMPSGWRGILPQGQTTFVMTSNDNLSNIFALADVMTLQEAAQTMNGNIPLGAGIIFRPSEKTVQTGNVVRNYYTLSANGQQMKGYIATIVGENGYGVSYIAAAPPAAFDNVKRDVERMIVSTKFKTQPKPSDAKVGSWMAYLKGRYIARYYFGSGYSEERHLWLCSDGSCRFYSGASGSSVNGSGLYSKASVGSWQATGATTSTGELTITFDDGSVSSFRLSFNGDELHLDGKKWLRGANEFCR